MPVVQALAPRTKRAREGPPDGEGSPDGVLVSRLRAGDESAFEAIFRRHQPPLLSFCRHMLGGRDDAEDALQQTFIRAHRALLSTSPPRDLRPWLYTIARNCCHTALAGRRAVANLDDHEPALDGLDDTVHQRADLRELVGDLQALAEDQRSALLLAELEDLSHEQIAGIVDCPVKKVKALIHQARTTLIAQRDARAAPCEEIRTQLSLARGGELRRGPLLRHLGVCAGCRDYAAAVNGQRAALAVILPVIPSAGLAARILGHTALHAGGLGVGGAGGVGAAGGMGVAASGHAIGATAAVAGGGASATAAATGSAGISAVIGGGLGAKLAIGGAVAVIASAGAATTLRHHHPSDHRPVKIALRDGRSTAAGPAAESPGTSPAGAGTSPAAAGGATGAAAGGSTSVPPTRALATGAAPLVVRRRDAVRRAARRRLAGLRPLGVSRKAELVAARRARRRALLAAQGIRSRPSQRVPGLHAKTRPAPLAGAVVGAPRRTPRDPALAQARRRKVVARRLAAARRRAGAVVPPGTVGTPPLRRRPPPPGPGRLAPNGAIGRGGSAIGGGATPAPRLRPGTARFQHRRRP